MRRHLGAKKSMEWLITGRCLPHDFSSNMGKQWTCAHFFIVQRCLQFCKKNQQHRECKSQRKRDCKSQRDLMHYICLKRDLQLVLVICTNTLNSYMQEFLTEVENKKILTLNLKLLFPTGKRLNS